MENDNGEVSFVEFFGDYDLLCGGKKVSFKEADTEQISNLIKTKLRY